MKLLLITISVFYLSCSDYPSSNTKNAKSRTINLLANNTFKLICSKPDIEGLIFRYDTTYDYPDYKGHTIKSFDKEKRLLQVFVSNLFESNTEYVVSSTTIYDTAGYVIYEDKTRGGIRLHCYCYHYDTEGHLIFKWGYSSGETGIRESCIYENGRLIKKIVERVEQEVEIIY